MKQYSRIKEKHRDSILLFRMGDFYEMFYEDALTASRVLGLTLTSRDKDSEGRVPLAGIPWHSAERYISRLIENGYSVAVCDQTEAPDRRKKLVAREVVEVITPGTVLSEGLLEAGRNNYVASVAGDDPCGIAVADVSTGEFSAGAVQRSELVGELERLSPAEIVVPEGSRVRQELEDMKMRRRGPKLTVREAWQFSPHVTLSNLTSHFGTPSLEPFGFSGDEPCVLAAGALLGYLKELKGTGLGHIFKLTNYRQSEHLLMDDTTIRNLELVRSLRHGTEEGSLLGTIRRTETAAGARHLRSAVLRPLTDVESIRLRHDATDELFRDVRLRERLGEALRGMPDVERVLSRIANRKGGPREIVALGRALRRIPEVKAVLSGAACEPLTGLAESIGDTSELAGLIERALVEDAPVLARGPGFIREGYDEELDLLRLASREAKEWIGRLQAAERERTGVASLRVGFNKVFGYYIEVTKPNLARVPSDYIRKQTLVNAERFVTAELKEKENVVLGGEERELESEMKLLAGVQDRVTAESRTILESASAVAQADFLLSLARVALERKYVRPTVGHGTRILLTDSRHPVVEAMLEDETFVPNDLDLDCDERQMMVITGPNMAGKSTFTRQAALAVILAQAGSFVPAESAEVGIVDRIFCRLGASDDIARGRSTFLAEMSETASILNNCTRRSLVVMDEIGRGTSTFDGMSIAWAVLEHLHELGPRTLFATHYHELTCLESQLARVRNLNVLVKEWGEKIVFVHKVVEGSSDRSYGIQVARLAGLPDSVVERAREVLLAIQDGKTAGPARPAPRRRNAQLDMFGDRVGLLLAELAGLDTDRMTPMEALRTLARLKAKYLGPEGRPEADGIEGAKEDKAGTGD
ncbi:MAG: DNA mismatch repair protein MutS [Candidatus Eisenbacteria bacterium]|nr:DNA mismatch repair protein MutS [Candidatus Eisenbacteria bacterium]